MPLTAFQLHDSVGKTIPTFCEAVLPNTVSGEAEKQFTVYIPKGELICNSTRFEAGRILDDFRNLFDSQKQHITFQVPPWEYAARQAERRIGLCIGGQAVTGIALLLCVLGKAVKFIREKRRAF